MPGSFMGKLDSKKNETEILNDNRNDSISINFSG